MDAFPIFTFFYVITVLFYKIHAAILMNAVYTRSITIFLLVWIGEPLVFSKHKEQLLSLY